MPLPNRKKPRLGRGRTFLHSCCCWCPCVLAGTRQSPARDGTPPSTVPEPRNRSPDSNTIPSFRLVNVWYVDRTGHSLHHAFL
jgi:hypothetical protein